MFSFSFLNLLICDDYGYYRCWALVVMTTEQQEMTPVAQDRWMKRLLNNAKKSVGECPLLENQVEKELTTVLDNRNQVSSPLVGDRLVLDTDDHSHNWQKRRVSKVRARIKLTC